MSNTVLLDTDGTALRSDALGRRVVSNIVYPSTEAVGSDGFSPDCMSGTLPMGCSSS